MTTPPTPGRARLRALRLGAALLAATTLAVAGPTATPASAAAATPAAYGIPATTWWAEIDLFHQINGVRWLSGRRPLYFHGVLGDQASAWSAWMAAIGQLAHHPDLGAEASHVTAGWTGAAEIVGRGPDVASVLRGFLASPPHRDKILGDWDAMGVGIVRSGGELWVTVRFLR